MRLPKKKNPVQDMVEILPATAAVIVTEKKFTYKIDSKISKKGHFLKASKVLERTQESVNHFYEVYDNLGKGVTGAPSHTRQDVLRAMLVFATAGIDIFLKQIIKDTLPKVIKSDEDSERTFCDFIERRLKKVSSLDLSHEEKMGALLDLKFVANALGAVDSREYLLKEYEKSLTKNSLQSADEILKIGAAFALKSEQIRGDISQSDLKGVFTSRNEIIHEMDINFAKIGSSDTKKRKKTEIVNQCKIIFKIMINFINEIDRKF